MKQGKNREKLNCVQKFSYFWASKPGVGEGDRVTVSQLASIGSGYGHKKNHCHLTIIVNNKCKSVR